MAKRHITVEIECSDESCESMYGCCQYYDCEILGSEDYCMLFGAILDTNSMRQPLRCERCKIEAK